jgi:hypothetical protein
MIGDHQKIVLGLVLLAAACCLILGNARAQETWSGSGSASKWQAGTTATPASTERGAISGGSSSWNSGRTNGTSAAQPGGVWSDGSEVSAAGVTPGGKVLAGSRIPAIYAPAPAGATTPSNLVHLKTATTPPRTANSLSTSAHPKTSASQRAANAKAFAHGQSKLQAGARGVTHGRGQINFKANSNSSSFGAGKQTDSTSGQRPGRHSGNPDNPGEPAGPGQPAGQTGLDGLPHD